MCDECNVARNENAVGDARGKIGTGERWIRRIADVDYMEAYTARPLWWAVGDNLGFATGEPLVGQIDDERCELHDRHGLPLARSDSLKALHEAKNQYDMASQKWADNKLVITLVAAYRQAQQDMDKLRSALELLTVDDLSLGTCENCPLGP